MEWFQLPLLVWPAACDLNRLYWLFHIATDECDHIGHARHSHSFATYLFGGI
jgi:hypothetical protein